jgi:hypothetical protein
VGRCGEDRLHLRRVEKLALPIGAVLGLVISPGTISGDAGRMLVIFLGLVSASVLPTISLLVNSMSASGRSVKAIDELNHELEAAMDALFLLFGCVGIVVFALVALATPPPTLLTRIPFVTTDVLPRAGQAVVVISSFLTLLRVGLIPGVLRRSLAIRHRIAIDEARRKTLENAPKTEEMRATFTTHPDFGKPVRLEDIQGGDPH